MITIYILASHQNRTQINKFWVHLAVLQRQIPEITWTEPLFVENIPTILALVPTQQTSYLVIGGLSDAFLAAVLEQPALREFIEGASLMIPLLLSPCAWDEAPSPFAGKVPLVRDYIARKGKHADELYAQAAVRIKQLLKLQQGRR